MYIKSHLHPLDLKLPKDEIETVLKTWTQTLGKAIIANADMSP